MSNFDFSFNTNFEFSMGKDYMKEDEETCPKPSQLVFNLSEPCRFSHPFRFDEDCSSPREDVEQLHFFSAQQNDLMSLNSFSVNDDGPALSLDHTMSTGNTKTGSKRTFSNTNLTLSLSPEDEMCCEDIESLSEKDEESNEYLAKECPDGDLNLFVQKLLNSTAVDYLKDQGIEVDDKTAKLLTVNKRKRKTKNQVQLLEAEYKDSSDWSKEYMQDLAVKLNMSPASIYKWHWDQKHKKDVKPKSNKKRDQKRVSKVASH